MSIHGVLGETTSYPQSYAPQVLFAISRNLGRDEIVKNSNIDVALLSVGVDIWQAFELSWLDELGVSQMAVARIAIPVNSPNIVESKSLKLYLNSLNFSQFADQDTVKRTIEQDLSACVGAAVSVQIEQLATDCFDIVKPVGECIDDALVKAGQSVAIVDDVDTSFLANDKQGDNELSYCFYSNLLRSNCPVTNQPDWGTLQVSITTKHQLDYAKILSYILSFRKHNGFHEQCVEQIFADLFEHYQPSKLLVQANYTRRGGIDINPVRAFGVAVPTAIGRLVRQ